MKKLAITIANIIIVIKTDTLRFVFFVQFNFLNKSFSINLLNGIRIKANAKPSTNGINVLQKLDKNFRIIEIFLKIKNVITISMPDNV